MSPTERICVALLGWQEISREDIPSSSIDWVAIDGRFFYSQDGAHWPDFTTLDGCALFEAELVKRDWWVLYLGRLVMISKDVIPTISRPPAMPDVELMSLASAVSVLLANPAQRVAACLRVLDEAHL